MSPSPWIRVSDTIVPRTGALFAYAVLALFVTEFERATAAPGPDSVPLRRCYVPGTNQTVEGICVPFSHCPPLVDLKIQRKFVEIRPYMCFFDNKQTNAASSADKIYVCCRVSALKCRQYRQEVKHLTDQWAPEAPILSLRPSDRRAVSSPASAGMMQFGGDVDRKCPGDPAEYGIRALIVNGVPADPDEFPHLVALGLSKKGLGWHFPCGGSLISKRWVLSAAHCFIEPLTVARIHNGIQGEYNKFDPRRDFLIEETIIHPDYRGTVRESVYSDIALARLQENGFLVPIKISLKVYPGCLAQLEAEKMANKEAQIAGWGHTKNLGDKSAILLKGTVKVMTQSECGKVVAKNVALRKIYTEGVGKGVICAFDPVQRSDACQGDSGGPMCIKGPHCVYDVIGIVSKGLSCGTNLPGFYADVYHHLAWIEKHVWPIQRVLAEMESGRSLGQS